MSTVALTEPRVRSVEVTEKAIVAELTDGRIISVPLEWSWRLKEATPEQRAHWEILGDGQGVRWPDIDEDISVEGMLRGVPARRPSTTETRTGESIAPGHASQSLPTRSRRHGTVKGRRRPPR